MAKSKSMAGSERTKLSSVGNYVYTYFKYDAEKQFVQFYVEIIVVIVVMQYVRKNLMLNILHIKKKHLKTCHPEQYKCFETAEIKEKKRIDLEKNTLPKNLNQGSSLYQKSTFILIATPILKVPSHFTLCLATFYWSN